MLSFKLFMLVVIHIINVGHSTRLPLEVYELTPHTAGGNDLKHKNLEYSTINGQTSLSSSSSSSSSLAIMTHSSIATHAIGSSDGGSRSSNHHGEILHSHEDTELKILPSSKEAIEERMTTTTTTTAASTTNQLDRRRSRQMLDIMQKTHHDSQTGNHKLPILAQGSSLTGAGASGGGGVSFGHRDRDTLASSSSSSSTHRSVKDVRILYQVGNSEDDLPICAPNAVCSKIDLYETPWIERQCRCPAVNRSPEIVIHHHHKDSSSSSSPSSSSSHSNHNSEKYHTFYEHSKLLHQQNKHLLLDASQFAGDKKYESLHLKKLMHKLGAVYEDDLNLPSDYVMHEETNSALGSADDAILYGEEFVDNEFPSHVAMKRHHLYSNSPHMRHSGHMGHGERISYIGGCPSGLGVEDGHTIADKTRHYKMCQPVHRLPVCRHFRDFTWTLTTSAEMNTTEQIVHCRCPKNSVTYLTKREPLDEDTSAGYKYLFACSPLTRLRCQRKQPCKLFTVRKRQEFIDEVNINALCQCPKGHHCPSHHTQSGVLAGETFLEDNIQTYSGYCMAND